MTHATLIRKVWLGTDARKSAVVSVAERLFTEIAKAVERGERVVIPGFGTFSGRTRKARRVVCQGAEYQLAPQAELKFKASKHQKRKVGP